MFFLYYGSITIVQQKKYFVYFIIFYKSENTLTPKPKLYIVSAYS